MYKLTNFNSIIRLSDNACIPMDKGNRDYREYLEWIDEGNSPIPADIVIPVEPVPTQEERISALESVMLDLLLGV